MEIDIIPFWILEFMPNSKPINKNMHKTKHIIAFFIIISSFLYYFFYITIYL